MDTVLMLIGGAVLGLTYLGIARMLKMSETDWLRRDRDYRFQR